MPVRFTAHLHRLAATVLILALPAIPSLGSAQSADVIDPAASEILRTMSGFLANAPGYLVDVEVLEDEILLTGEMIQYRRSLHIAVRRPDRLRIEEVGDRGRRRLIYDGRTVTLVDFTSGTYAVADAPATLDEALDLFTDRYGLVMPGSDFAYSDPYTALTEDATQGVYLGVSEAYDTPLHHVAFRQDDLDWQLWLPEKVPLLPARLLLVSKTDEGYPRMAVEMTNWRLAPYAPDVLFTFSPPDDLLEIEMLPVSTP
jgi:hypothetical protein